jgi:hypothetical protein
MKLFLSILFCVAGLSVSAQDLTGIWRGNFNQSSNSASRLMELLGTEDRYKFEVQLDQHDRIFEGVTYSYKTTVFYGKATCKGTVNPATRKVYLEEGKLVELRMSMPGDACVMTLFLQYSKTGDEEFLEGSYTSMNAKDSTNCGKGTVLLRRVTTSDFYKEPFLVEREKQKEREEQKKRNAITKITPVNPPVNNSKTNTNPPPKTTIKKTTPKQQDTKPAIVEAKPEIKTVPADTFQKAEVRPAPALPTPKDIAGRENELVKTIVTDANEVVINIYDNGTVDGDTISVYLDKKLVLSKRRLTEKALTLKFKLDETINFHELVMVAENLGEIPPNTSLMIVNAGNKQYEVRITSTEQKNAVVNFKYER